MVYLTRRERFNAAHRLFNPAWSETQNRAVFGKCANPNFHGHNYQLFITVKGEVDPETGFVVNVHLLGQIIKKEIVEKLDHSNLNLDVDFMKNIIPSTENLAKGIWKELEKYLEDCELHCVKLLKLKIFTLSILGTRT